MVSIEKHHSEVRSAGLNEKNNCVPVAIATVMERDYNEINDKMVDSKVRKLNKGSITEDWVNFVESDLNTPLYEVTDQVKELGGITVKTIERVCTKGKFLVVVKGHALALVDGKVYDRFKSRRHRIKRVFSLQPMKNIKLESYSSGVQKKLDQRLELVDEFEKLDRKKYSGLTTTTCGRWLKVRHMFTGNYMLLAKRGDVYHVAITPSVKDFDGIKIGSPFEFGTFSKDIGVEGKETKSYTLFKVKCPLFEILEKFNYCN